MNIIILHGGDAFKPKLFKDEDINSKIRLLFHLFIDAAFVRTNNCWCVCVCVEDTSSGICKHDAALGFEQGPVAVAYWLAL